MHEDLTSKIDRIEQKNFVPFIHLRWVVGILISMILCLYGYTIKTLYDTQDIITEIRLQQRTIIYRIETMQESIYDLKWENQNGPARNRKNSKDGRS